jgi:peptidoglycan/xylan/chitin deacetylase (PgdA/CDA1 family)
MRLVLERLLPKPRALILAYHRVAELATDPCGLATSPPLFESHLEILKSRFSVLALSQLVERLRAGCLPDGSVALTFDDGYQDNLSQAAPILARFGCPATFFATALEPEAGEFWWDRLDGLLLQAEAEKHRDWRRWQRPVSEASERFQSYYALLERMKPGPQSAFLAELAGVSGAEQRSSHRRLSAPELGQLVELGFELGCHTLSHPRLPFLSREEQRHEIEGARVRLGGAVAGFAFPYGACSRTSLELVKQAGFGYACLAQPGTLWRGSNPWRLPRCQADGLSCQQLEQLLRQLD